MCNLSWTPHSNLEKDNSLNHYCVSPKIAAMAHAIWLALCLCEGFAGPLGLHDVVRAGINGMGGGAVA